MVLELVKTKEELEQLYKELQLTNTNDKIKFLKKEMAVLASRDDEYYTEDELLLSYEELALDGIWKALK